MFCLLVIFVIVILIVLSYWKVSRRYSYWSDRGVPQGKPIFLLGDMWPVLFRKESAPEMTQKIYNFSQNARYVGSYQFLSPALFIRDPDLVKHVAVKDFDHFVDHRSFVTPDGDTLFGKNLINISGQEWREMRNLLTPCFTANKMKFMFSLISQSGERFVRYFLKKEEDLVTVEMKDVISRFATDCIGNTVFGIDCDSLEDPKNEFYLMAKEASDFTDVRKLLAFVGYMIAPKLCEFFKVQFFSPKIKEYFSGIVKENIKSRQKQNIVRPDMISILLEAQKNAKGDSKRITDEDITAQAFVFFFAGYDTVSTLMCFMAHELAVNPQVQEKLKREVDETREKCDGKITYEDVTTMKYLDMVVSETLRKWPTNIATDRICTKPYTIEPKNPNEKPLHLNKNDVLYIPMYAIQRDPEYYPDPERFDPERFSAENKSKIVPYSYIPFGVGPRVCIGLRFAILETKILFYHMLSHFEIVPVEETQIPIRLSKKAGNMQSERGFWLGLQRRH